MLTCKHKRSVRRHIHENQQETSLTLSHRHLPREITEEDADVPQVKRASGAVISTRILSENVLTEVLKNGVKSGYRRMEFCIKICRRMFRKIVAAHPAIGRRPARAETGFWPRSTAGRSNISCSTRCGDRRGERRTSVVRGNKEKRWHGRRGRSYVACAPGSGVRRLFLLLFGLLLRARCRRRCAGRRHGRLSRAAVQPCSPVHTSSPWALGADASGNAAARAAANASAREELTRRQHEDAVVSQLRRSAHKDAT